MQKSNIDFNTILTIAQNKGYAEANPKNDIEGIDSAHKLAILSVLCFGVKFNFKNIFFEGIKNIDNLDSLNWIKEYFYKVIISILPRLKKEKKENILNNIHKYVNIPLFLMF